MKTMINIKVDMDTKVRAKETAEGLGLPLSTVINAYLKQFVRTKEIHLYSPEGELKPAVRKRLNRLHKDVAEGKNISRKFTDPKEMDAYLMSL